MKLCSPALLLALARNLETINQLKTFAPDEIPTQRVRTLWDEQLADFERDFTELDLVCSLSIQNKHAQNARQIRPDT